MWASAPAMLPPATIAAPPATAAARHSPASARSHGPVRPGFAGEPRLVNSLVLVTVLHNNPEARLTREDTNRRDRGI